MTREQRINTEIAKMEADAKLSNEINPGSVTKDDIDRAAAAIRRNNSDRGGRGTSTTDMLQSSRRQEISLMNQLKSLREQSLTVNTITSESKKYFDLQAQIEVLEQN